MNNPQVDIFKNLVKIFHITLASAVTMLTVIFLGISLYDGLSWEQMWEQITPLSVLIGLSSAGFLSIPVALTVWFLDTVEL